MMENEAAGERKRSDQDGTGMTMVNGGDIGQGVDLETGMVNVAIDTGNGQDHATEGGEMKGITGDDVLEAETVANAMIVRITGGDIVRGVATMSAVQTVQIAEKGSLVKMRPAHVHVLEIVSNTGTRGAGHRTQTNTENVIEVL